MQLSAIQLTLRNALAVARPQMRMTEENFQAMTSYVSLLTAQQYLELGIGEHVAEMSDNVQLQGDTLMVDANDTDPGVVKFNVAEYPFDIFLKSVVLEGADVDFVVNKKVPNGCKKPDEKTFNRFQLPLLSNNFELVVTIQPGGSLKRAVLLQELTL